MKIKFENKIQEHKQNIIFLFEDSDNDFKKREDLKAYQAEISSVLKNKEFKGNFKEKLPLLQVENGKNNWLILIGLGKKAELSSAKIIEVAATATQALKKINIKESFLNIFEAAKHSPQQVLELLTLGLSLGDYEAKNYKKDKSAETTETDKEKKLKKLTICGTTETIKNNEEIIERALITAKAVKKARDLANQPGNYCYPETFADKAQKVAQKYNLKIEVFNSERIKKEGFEALYAVGKGSSKEPYFLCLEYNGAEKTEKPIVLVGKGITFDSGGLSLKPAANMQNMKTDMSGAANVLYIIAAIAKMKLKINLVSLIPLAENLPDGNAYKPGDVINCYAGKTIEIINTDAEGRLILADALAYAKTFKPQMVIDIATLTGACIVALGSDCAGLFTNNGKLRKGLMDAAEEMGELLWPLPLIKEYKKHLKSSLADLAHVSTQASGGTINAALFLNEFVDNEVPWAHIDIAGPSRAASKTSAISEGGTGFSTATLIKYLTTLAK